MLTPHEIEAATLAAWPSIETVTDGSWQARFASGYTKRANSIHCMDPADGADSAARLERLADLYPQRHLPAVFRVTPLTSQPLLDALDAQNWRIFESSLVLSMPMARTDGFDGAAQFYAPTDPVFIDAQDRLNGFSPTERETLTAILDRLAVPAIGIVITADDGTPGASLLCVQADGIAIFLCVITDGKLRGQGFGRRMMATGLSWAAENGARAAALQVLATNAPAISLYLGMGFAYRYPYHYRLRPEPQ